MTRPDGGQAALEEAPTPREFGVPNLLTQGLANKPIAARLGITIRTLHTHIGSGTDPEVWKRARA